MERAAIVKDGAGQLAGNLVHIGDHQQQPLAGGKGGGQRAGLQRPVNGPGGSAFGLQFHHGGDGAPDVGFAHGGPRIGVFPHGRGGSNWVNGNYFVGFVGNVGCRLVAVNSYLLSGHYDVSPKHTKLYR
jgi:hypothetical protein